MPERGVWVGRYGTAQRREMTTMARTRRGKKGGGICLTRTSLTNEMGQTVPSDSQRIEHTLAQAVYIWSQCSRLAHPVCGLATRRDATQQVAAHHTPLLTARRHWLSATGVGSDEWMAGDHCAEEGAGRQATHGDDKGKDERCGGESECLHIRSTPFKRRRRGTKTVPGTMLRPHRAGKAKGG